MSVTIKEALGRVRERSSFLLIPAVKELPDKKFVAEVLFDDTNFGRLSQQPNVIRRRDHRMVEAEQIVTDVSNSWLLLIEVTHGGLLRPKLTN